MKILLTVTDTGMGGVTTAAVNFSNELIKRGHEVVFLDMSGKNQVCDRLDNSVKLGKLSGRSRYWQLGAGDLGRVGGVKKLFLAALGIAKKLTIRSGLWHRLVFKKYKEYGEFDVAIAYRQCAPCYSFVLNKVKAKKKLGFVHGELAYMGDISSWQGYMKRFDNVCYVSHAVKDQFVEKYPELKKNAAAVYNFFDIDKIKALSNESCDIDFDKSKVNIVTVARIDNAFKRINVIPFVCESLKKSCTRNFHWYIVGDGPDRADVEKLIVKKSLQDVITLLGVKSNPYPYIKNADFTVLTSKSEAYPMTVYESFICGAPIVASRFASLTEMMTDEKEGLISEQDIDSLAECVKAMIENTGGVRARCKEHLENTEFTNDKPYEQFLGAIGEI